MFNGKLFIHYLTTAFAENKIAFVCNMICRQDPVEYAQYIHEGNRVIIGVQKILPVDSSEKETSLFNSLHPTNTFKSSGEMGDVTISVIAII